MQQITLYKYDREVQDSVHEKKKYVQNVQNVQHKPAWYRGCYSTRSTTKREYTQKESDSTANHNMLVYICRQSSEQKTGAYRQNENS